MLINFLDTAQIYCQILFEHFRSTTNSNVILPFVRVLCTSRSLQGTSELQPRLKACQGFSGCNIIEQKFMANMNSLGCTHQSDTQRVHNYTKLM